MGNLTLEKRFYRHFVFLPLLGQTTSLPIGNLPLDMFNFPEHKMHAKKKYVGF
jgi:hypothetical protein